VTLVLNTTSRVLVTGASGLIGRCVVRLLRGQVPLYGVSRDPPVADDDVIWLEADLGERGAAARIVAHVEPRAVVHLAGAVRGDRTLDAVLPTLQANLVGTVELLEAATRADVSRIVVSGSLLEEPASGDPVAVPSSPYGASRWASSMYARLFHAHFGTPVTVLRPSYVYGPGQRDKLIPHVISCALEGRPAELASGERMLDFVYADDVARAYIAALDAPAVLGQTVDIGYGALSRVSDVVETVLDLIGPDAPRPSYGAVPVRKFEQEIAVDTEPAKRLLGWTATTTLDEGLRHTVDWFKAAGLSPA
jgi:UDP-glucose 4-epimerase